MDKDEETALASIVRQKNEAADKLTAGSLFLNKMELQVALKHYNLFRGAKTKVTASSGDRLSTTCLDAQCSFKLTSTSQRPGRRTMSRKIVLEKYPFKVNQFSPHTCHGSLSTTNPNACPLFISRNPVVRTKIRANSFYLTRDIMHDMKILYNVDVPYLTAHRAKKFCIDDMFGGYEENFSLLPLYKYYFDQTAQDSILIYSTNNEIFDKLFLMYGASRKGFEFCSKELLM
ncbi:hypothetical protein GEMRC1_008392 [Eukaryota sp. GEM-RC1]